MLNWLQEGLDSEAQRWFSRQLLVQLDFFHRSFFFFYFAIDGPDPLTSKKVAAGNRIVSD